jgi:hypothetical protein
LIPLWTQTPSQFGLVSSIFLLSSPGQLTRVSFTLSAYPIGIPESHPNSLSDLHPSTLPDRINAYLAKSPYPIILPIGLLLIQPYTVLPGRITLPDLFSIELPPT